MISTSPSSLASNLLSLSITTDQSLVNPSPVNISLLIDENDCPISLNFLATNIFVTLDEKVQNQQSRQGTKNNNWTTPRGLSLGVLCGCGRGTECKIMSNEVNTKKPCNKCRKNILRVECPQMQCHFCNFEVIHENPFELVSPKARSSFLRPQNVEQLYSFVAASMTNEAINDKTVVFTVVTPDGGEYFDITQETLKTYITNDAWLSQSSLAALAQKCNAVVNQYNVLALKNSKPPLKVILTMGSQTCIVCPV